ncbi:MAG: hypothetical protein ACYCR3_12740 [Acidithiobacillus sp.]
MLLVERSMLSASSDAANASAPFPDPMTPTDCDLREVETMPLNVRWLRDSDMVACTTGEAFRAAVLLMTASWHQLPAGSIPNDDRQLSVLAGCGRFLKEFLKVKSQALDGWILCSDNRWYHPEVARQVLIVWQEKQVDANKKVRRTAIAKTAANARWANALRTSPANGRGLFTATGLDYQDDDENLRVDSGQSLHASGMHDALREHCVSNASSHAESGVSPSASPMTRKCEEEKAGLIFPEVAVIPGGVPEFDLAPNVAQGEKTPRRKRSSAAAVRPSDQNLRETLLAIALPDWLSRDAWEQYVDFRFEIKNPLTLRARDLSIKKLSELREEGNDPVAVIEQSILNGWKGLFALKNQSANRFARRGPAERIPAASDDQKPERGAGSAVTRL